MADIFEIKEKVCSAAAKAGENLKELDTGVALTKAKDLILRAENSRWRTSLTARRWTRSGLPAAP